MSDRLHRLVEEKPDPSTYSVGGPANPRLALKPPLKKFSELTPQERAAVEQKFKDESAMLGKYDEEKGLQVKESLYFVGSVNYKETFYRSKFDCDGLDVIDLRNHVRDYFVEGLVWNMAYYYQGCISWEWYYPYYYAPFPSDFINIRHVENHTFNMVTLNN